MQNCFSIRRFSQELCCTVNEYFSLHILHNTFINGYLRSCFTTNLKNRNFELLSKMLSFKTYKQFFLLSFIFLTWNSYDFFSLQNAMRATVEHQENCPSLTPIEVIVVLGKEDLTIKVTIFCFCSLVSTKTKQDISILVMFSTLSDKSKSLARVTFK